MELSIVIPCLNEEDTLAACIQKAQGSLQQHQIDGEIIVADNGSTDNSVKIASELGTKVVSVATKGYGSALIGGIQAASGKYIIMADADDSYDLSQVHRFVEKLREGYDMVMGCRLKRGGGTVLPGAMPILHRLIGNPLFSFLIRWWFKSPINDVHCGMRGFTKSCFDQLNLQCTGMEFASEMIIKASISNVKIAEIPITLHPDGRKAHAPHLRTFRDGWRHLRFYLIYSPRWLFLMPGFGLIFVGLLFFIAGMLRTQIGNAVLDVHTILVACMLLLCGYQSILFAAFTKVYAISQALLPPDKKWDAFFRLFSLERGLIIGCSQCVIGIALVLHAVWEWQNKSFGALDYSYTMRWVIPGSTLTVLGLQTTFSSFFLSILGLKQK